MCGICGLFGRDTPDPGLVEAMNAAIVHRGPDHGAVESHGRCVLGYRRLSIIDLQTGDQPVANERGDVVAVFHGELYNFRELAFASETKALLQLPALPRALDLEQLDAYLALQYVPRSGLQTVEKVPPASTVVVEGGSLSVERYWAPQTASDKVLLADEAVARV